MGWKISVPLKHDLYCIFILLVFYVVYIYIYCVIIPLEATLGTAALCHRAWPSCMQTPVVVLPPYPVLPWKEINDSL